MSEHTPTPWAVGDLTLRGIVKDAPDIADGYDHYMIAVTSAHSLLPASEAQANAAFIVEAVNSYEAMKDALQACQRVLADLVGDDSSLSSLHLYAHAVAAEAKARSALPSRRQEGV